MFDIRLCNANFELSEEGSIPEARQSFEWLIILKNQWRANQNLDDNLNAKNW